MQSFGNVAEKERGGDVFRYFHYTTPNGGWLDP